MENSALMEIIQKRRSVRKFLSRPVEPWKIEAMVEAARLAPSACNVQPWRFIAVTDEKKREALSTKALGGIVPNTFAREAPLLMVLCADTHTITESAGAIFKHIQYHQVDCGISGEHLVLRAAELGIGTCWIGWFDEHKVRSILKIPRSIRVLSLIACGYYDEEALKAKATKKALQDILFWNGYQP